VGPRIAVAVCLAAGLTLLCAEAGAKGQRWAVVVGIGKYRDPTIRPLRYAVADARAMHAFLVDPNGGGFPPANVQLLLDQQATQVTLRSALGTTLARRAVRGDTVFIYYAGHGALEADLSGRELDGYAKYLIPHDASTADLFASAINMAEVEIFFSRIQAETVVLALDTCYSGAGGGRGFANLPPGRDARGITLQPDFLARLARGRGRAILTAADTNEVALELAELGHGLFTYHLLEALRGKADIQGKGYVTLQDAYRYVYDRVARHSRQVGGSQSPKLMTQAVGEIVLAGRVPAAVAAVPPAPAPTVRVLPRPGSLVIRSARQRVEVRLGDRRLGEAGPGGDLLVENIPAGLHRLRATAKHGGFKTLERDVRVAAGQRLELAVDLEALGPAPVVGGEDGAEMVLVPAGEFWMGSTPEQVAQAIDDCTKRGVAEARCREWYELELPRHRVVLDAYYLDRYEVTNVLFERFVRATGHRTAAEREGHGWVRRQEDAKWTWDKVVGATWRTPSGPGSVAAPTHPVVQVSWEDANAYCRWAGKRLPTEAEWEKAARGTDGRVYPWGDAWDPSKANGDRRVKATSPVGSYPAGASPYGAHDLAGNVWEWVADWSAPDYYPRSPHSNPKGPDSGTFRVLRGGSWLNYPFNLRSAYRHYDSPDVRIDLIGFRCARGSS
jgi:formylglycine-generating enzyme required for sulfatase activity